MRRAPQVISLCAALIALALLATHKPWRGRLPELPRGGSSVERVEGAVWRVARAWDFAAGDWPGAWSWGRWQRRGEWLAGTAAGDSFAVYVCPLEHDGEFLLDTVLRFVAREPAHAPEAHLLTRDGAELHCESGSVLFGGEPRLSVRHMVGGQDRLLRVVTLPAPVEMARWYQLQVAVRRGRATVWLDGHPVFRSPPDQPLGVYAEPHLAVRHGTVEFRSLRVLVAP